MSKNLDMCRLLDLYGGLLTEKQFDIMDLYYNDDLSLGEIADHYDISRQGVHDAIKRGDEALAEYEAKLGLLKADEDRKNGLHFKFNVSVVLRADQETQMRTLSTAVTNGVYTPNEARRLLDMPDRDGGDRLYVNGNVLPIELAGIQYTRDTGGENDE